MSITNSLLNAQVTRIVTRAMGAAGSTAAIDSSVAARIADDIAKLPLADQVQAWRQVDEFTHVSVRRPVELGRIAIQVLPMGTPDDAAVSLFQTASAEAAKQLRQHNPGIEPDMIQGAFVSPPPVADVPYDIVGARIWGDGTVRVVMHQGQLVPKETLPGERLDPLFPVSTATAPTPTPAPLPTPQPAQPAQPAQPPQGVALSGDILTLRVNGTSLTERLTGAMKTNGPMTLLEVRRLVLSLGGPSVSESLATQLISALINSGQLVADGPLWRAA